MYIPLQLRLTLFYAILLGLALWFFGQMVYTQAAQRAYRDLDTTLSSRTASVRLGKDLFIANPPSLPLLLPSVDSVGTQGVSIEILDDQLTLLATTSGSSTGGPQTSVGDNSTSPTPWDAKAAHTALEHADSQSGIYSTVTYQGQHVRVYTLLNNDLGQSHVIQAARSEQDIEQSLTDLRLLLIRGGALVVVLALVGGWFISWGVLSAVHRMTRTAQNISTSGDFHQRVPERSWFGRDELTTLAAAFNQMLANLEALYQQQQRFVADASHELRAPITSIRCNLDLLAKAPDLPPEEAQAALDDAQAEANRMGRLVGDLLTLARSDEAAQDVKSNGYRKHVNSAPTIDLDSLILDVYRQYKQTTLGDNVEIRQQGPRLMLQDITPAKVYGDADQLKQVLVA